LNHPLKYTRENITHIIKLILIIFSFHNFLIDIDDEFSFEEDISMIDNINENMDENHEDDENINDDNDSVIRDILFHYIYWKRY
jgi:hypothetical protein